MRALATALSELLNEEYGKKMGFFLVVGPEGTGGVSDYIGNITRGTGIEWMKETIERLEKNQDIPVTQGNA